MAPISIDEARLDLGLEPTTEDSLLAAVSLKEDLESTSRVNLKLFMSYIKAII